jgi:Family of unknown function (DUF6932)
MQPAKRPILPEFNADGVLPAGDYPLTLAQLRASMLVVGPGVATYPNWDSQWRAQLVDNLSTMVNQLWQVGVSEIFVDGSFVEDKDHPNDIDGYFEADFVSFYTRSLEQRLNAIDPFKAWTWEEASRRHDANSCKRQLPMWFIYHVELYPHVGLPTGIVDRYGNQQQFPAAFRRSRNAFKPKGIIKIVR